VSRFTPRPLYIRRDTQCSYWAPHCMWTGGRHSGVSAIQRVIDKLVLVGMATRGKRRERGAGVYRRTYSELRETVVPNKLAARRAEYRLLHCITITACFVFAKVVVADFCTPNNT